MNFKAVWAMIRETFSEWSEDKAPRLAAALSYYTVFSLAPLLVLVIAITGFIVGNNESIRSMLLTQVQGMAGQQAANAVNTLINNTSQPRSGIIATVIGIVTLILGATGVFGQLQDSLNTIWEVQPKKGGGIFNMFKERFLSFTMVLGMSFLLLVSLVISAALSVVNHFFTGIFGGLGIVAQVINIVFSIGVISLIFALIYKYLPDAKISWKDVWIGAVATAILFTIGKQVLSLYLGSSAATSAYGAAGSLVVILLWVYYSAQILFMGAEFTQVYARWTGSQIAPAENAQAVTEGERANQGMPRKQTAPSATSQAVPSSLPPAMLPVTGQPAFHIPPETSQERVRYEPLNPATVIPVIAAGAAAGIYTVTRVIRKILA